MESKRKICLCSLLEKPLPYKREMLGSIPTTNTMLRLCTKCEIEKPVADFSKKTEKYLHSYCKPCVLAYSKEHYRKNPATYRARLDAKEGKLRKYLRDLKDGKQCMDCLVAYPHYMLDFDHRDGATKVAEVSTLVKGFGTLKAIEEEVAKCDLVCANCHRSRTYWRSRRETASLL